MKPELERVKDDLETMQKALGLAPSMGRDWVRWMKRDRWFSLWWCLPGFILIAATFLPHEPKRYGGLVLDQWAGLLVAAVMLGITAGLTRKVTARDGRPEGLIREARRVNGMTAQGFWFSVALAAQGVAYFVWASHYRVGFEAFWAGIFLILGSSCLMGAIAGRAWLLLGWAIPFLGYGICVPLVGVHTRLNGVLFGLMFVAVALSFSMIATLQIRMLERQHDAH